MRATPDSKSLSARLAGRLEEFLSWPLLGRVLFLIVFLEAAALAGAMALPLAARSRGAGPTLNARVTAEAVRWCLLFAAVNPLLVGLGLWAKKRPGSHAFFYALVAAATTFELFYYIYLAGFQSTAVLAISGAVAVVRLALDRPLGLFTLFNCVLGLSVLTVLTADGTIPYAPLLMDESSAESFAQTPFLGWTSTILVSLMLAVQFAVVDFVTERMWNAIASLRAANETLRQTQAALVRAESLAAVGSLVTGAAHELRNPLGSSSALFQSLRDEIRASEPLPESDKKELLDTLDRALRGQERAGAIVERLYRLTDDLETRGSQAVLGDFLGALEKSYPGILLDVAPEARRVRVRHALFKTLLPNLLDNALASGSAAKPELKVKTRDGFLDLTVEDRGRGIPESLRKDLFKPFATGQKAGEGHGVGLGLYIVHELVTRLGGSVELESEEGKGTRVTLKVPVG